MSQICQFFINNRLGHLEHLTIIIKILEKINYLEINKTIKKFIKT